MFDENKCCGLHITKCAKIVAFIGLITSCLSVITALFLWYYIPSAIILALVYAYVIFGILMEKPNFLLPALVVLSISIFINFFTFFALLIVGSIAPVGISTVNVDYDKVERARAAIRVAYFISAAIILISTIYNIFALFVINKTREFLISSIQLTTELPTNCSSPTTLPFSFPTSVFHSSTSIPIPASIPNKQPLPPPYSES